jgi:hypothetical protein
MLIAQRLSRPSGLLGNQEPACGNACECMTEYYLRVIDLEEKYYNPEAYCIADDLSSVNAPFISMDTYNEFPKPHYM